MFTKIKTDSTLWKRYAFLLVSTSLEQLSSKKPNFQLWSSRNIVSDDSIQFEMVKEDRQVKTQVRSIRVAWQKHWNHQLFHPPLVFKLELGTMPDEVHVNKATKSF